jgi:hypothetical protein
VEAYIINKNHRWETLAAAHPLCHTGWCYFNGIPEITTILMLTSILLATPAFFQPALLRPAQHAAVTASMVATTEPLVAPAEEPVGEEAPLTGPQRVKRALTFWSRVVPILGAYKARAVPMGPTMGRGRFRFLAADCC